MKYLRRVLWVLGILITALIILTSITVLTLGRVRLSVMLWFFTVYSVPLLAVLTVITAVMILMSRCVNKRDVGLGILLLIDFILGYSML